MRLKFNYTSNTKKSSFEKLRAYCESRQFKGWDPYDGLNSKVFRFLYLHKVRFFRLTWIQLFKRCPINLRRLFLVPKQYNPKGLGLFLSGYCNLYQKDPKPIYLRKINFLATQLLNLQSKKFSGACWGYNFDWQSRAFFLPKNTPNIVVTSYVACSLLDAYEITRNQIFLKNAISSSDFILKDLNKSKRNNGFIFSYSPFDNSCIYNASLLGSKLLARLYYYTKNDALIRAARTSIIACTHIQKKDGSWIYGELKIQNWIDSFHTGFNLESLYEYQKYSGDESFQSNISTGLTYYLNNFFESNGTPKYYNNQTYPVDIHAPAQLIITLHKLNEFNKNKTLVKNVLKWTIKNMQNSDKGFFYYQLKTSMSSKISYMRWAQAWMFYALTFDLIATNYD